MPFFSCREDFCFASSVDECYVLSCIILFNQAVICNEDVIIIILEMKKGGSGKLGHWSKFMQLVSDRAGI